MERTYTRQELIDFAQEIVYELGGQSDAYLYCQECYLDLREPGFALCEACKCEEVCDQPKHEDHGSLCADHARLAWDAALDERVNWWVAEARGK